MKKKEESKEEQKFFEPKKISNNMLEGVYRAPKHIYLIAKDIEIAKDSPIVQRLFIEYKGARMIDCIGPKYIYSYIYVMFKTFLRKGIKIVKKEVPIAKEEDEKNVEMMKPKEKKAEEKKLQEEKVTKEEVLKNYYTNLVKPYKEAIDSKKKSDSSESIGKLIIEISGEQPIEKIKKQLEERKFKFDEIEGNKKEGIHKLIILANCVSDPNTLKVITGKYSLKEQIKATIARLSELLKIEVKLFIVMDGQAEFEAYWQLESIGSMNLLVTRYHLFVLHSKRVCENKKEYKYSTELPYKENDGYKPSWVHKNLSQPEACLLNNPASRPIDHIRLLSALSSLKKDVHGKNEKPSTEDKEENMKKARKDAAMMIREALKNALEDNCVPEFKEKMKAIIGKQKERKVEIKKETTDRSINRKSSEPLRRSATYGEAPESTLEDTSKT